jgi:hypothetical protein
MCNPMVAARLRYHPCCAVIPFKVSSRRTTMQRRHWFALTVRCRRRRRLRPGLPQQGHQAAGAVCARRHHRHHRPRDCRAAGQGPGPERDRENKAGGGGMVGAAETAVRARRLLAGHGHRVHHGGQPGHQPQDPVQPADRLHAHHQHRGHAQRDRGAPQLPGQGLQGLSWPSSRSRRASTRIPRPAPAASATCRWSCSRT